MDETRNVTGQQLGTGNVVNNPAAVAALTEPTQEMEILDDDRSGRGNNNGDNVVVFNGPVNATKSHFGTGGIVNNR